MDKGKFLTAIITLGVSFLALFVIISFTFDNKLNQGNFMVSDIIVSSVAEFEDKAKTPTEWKYDISQNNQVSMLIQNIGDAKVKEIYLDKVKINTRNDVNIYIEQDKYETSVRYEEIKNKNVNIYSEQTEDGNYLIEFDIKNEDIISNYKVPTDVKKIKHDGTVFGLANIKLNEIKFKVKYNLVIVQENGKINTCKVELSVPDEKLVTDGFFVQKLNSSNYKFKVSY